MTRYAFHPGLYSGTLSATPGPEPYDLFEIAREVEVGDVVVFGNYVHSFASAYSDDISIRWLVLDKKDDKVLVISLYNITIGSFVNLETYLEYEENDTALVCSKYFRTNLTW